jgi:hypothetical protein
MRVLMAVSVLAGLAGGARAETLCPDGTFVPGDSCILSFDGSYVIGGPVTLTSDVLYLEGRGVAIVRSRIGDEYRIGQPQRNRILDAPRGTAPIIIPPLGK